MNWYRRNNNSNTLAVVSTVVVLFMVIDLATAGSIRDVLRVGTANVFITTDFLIQSMSESSFFKQKRVLARENAALKRQVEELQGTLVRYSIAQVENRALRGLLNVVDIRSAGVVARVVSRPPASTFGTFVVGVGSSAGIREGDLVVSESGAALGRVKEVGKRTSLVEMLTRAGLTSIVFVSGMEAEMYGKSGGNASITLPRDIDVKEGDSVLLAENGLLVGSVGAIKKKPSGSTQEILVYTPSGIASVQFVRIITSLIETP